MKRAVAIAAVAFAATTAGSALGEPSWELHKPQRGRSLPLTAHDASAFMRRALRRDRRLGFEVGDPIPSRAQYRRKVRCPKRLGRTRRRCELAWFAGDVSFRGRGTIWYLWTGFGMEWHYAYTLRRIDHYCRVVGRSRCVKVFRVR